MLTSEIFTAFVSEDNDTATEFLVARKKNNPLAKVRVWNWFPTCLTTLSIHCNAFTFSHAMPLQLRSLAIEDVVPVTKTVKPLKQHKERFLVESPPMTFIWAFSTDKADIGFEVLFNKQVQSDSLG